MESTIPASRIVMNVVLASGPGQHVEDEVLARSWPRSRRVIPGQAAPASEAAVR